MTFKALAFTMLWLPVSLILLSPIGVSAQDYTTMNLPDGAIARLGKGQINEVAFSPRGDILAVATSIGVWLHDTKTYREIGLLTDHENPAKTIAFNPDGKLLASGFGETIRVWDVDTQKQVNVFSGVARSVMFSPNGELLACIVGNRVIVWSTDTWQEMHTLSLAEHANVVSMQFRSDGTLLAVGASHSGKLLVVDTKKERTITSEATPEGYEFVRSMALSPDGTKVAVGSKGSVSLWSVDPLVEIATFSEYKGTVTSVAFNPDGKSLAAGSTDRTFRLWSVETQKIVLILSGDASSHVDFVAFSPDSQLLAVHAYNQLRFWSVKTQEEVASLSGYRPITFSPNGKYVSYVSANAPMRSAIQLWEVESQSEVARLADFQLGPDFAVLSPDDSMLAVGYRKGDSVSLWQISTRRNVAQLTVSWQLSLAFSPDSRRLAIGTSPFWSSVVFAQVWDLNRNQRVAGLKATPSSQGRRPAATSLAFSPNGSLLALGFAERNGHSWDYKGIQLWNFDTKSEATIPETTPLPETIPPGSLLAYHPSQALAFSPDGRLIASGHKETVQLWEVKTKEEFATLTGHARAVKSLAFHPRGQLLASGSFDGTIKLWDIVIQKDIATFNADTDVVLSMGFSPDGQWLASSAGLGIQLWNVRERKEITTLFRHTLSVVFVALTSDGESLVSVSRDGTVLLWDVLPVFKETIQIKD